MSITLLQLAKVSDSVSVDPKLIFLPIMLMSPSVFSFRPSVAPVMSACPLVREMVESLMIFTKP